MKLKLKRIGAILVCAVAAISAATALGSPGGSTASAPGLRRCLSDLLLGPTPAPARAVRGSADPSALADFAVLRRPATRADPGLPPDVTSSMLQDIGVNSYDPSR